MSVSLMKLNPVRVDASVSFIRVSFYYCNTMSETNELQRRKVYFGSCLVGVHLWSLGPPALETSHQDTTKFMA